MVPTKERPGSKAISMRKELKTGLYPYVITTI